MLCTFSAFAQAPLTNLVFTVGTPARDAASNDWSYVLVNASSPELIAGKRFAVYSKTGYPTNAGTFALRGTIFQQNDPAAINTLLNQSVALGQNLTLLSNAMNTLLHNVPGITNQPLPQKILTAFQNAATNPSTAEVLVLLGNGHPAIHLCAGHAFAEPIAVTTTYEVREVNPATGGAGDVVGRVTIVPNAPVILFAPGQPFQVKTNLPSDHLLIRLRWGTPPELRRLSLLQFGFNVWRIPKAAAESGGFNVTPPTIAQLHSNTNFTRANPNAAVFANKDFSIGSGAGAADDPADRTTYFFGDNGRPTLHTNFNAGDLFYYFITARDLLGRDGLASPGRLTIACRRLPPAPPNDVRVDNGVVPGSTNQARLLVAWTQNTNAADAVGEYWIYRWLNPTDSLTNSATPSSNRVGIVAQLAGTNVNSFLDTSTGALTNANLSNVWYTVVAVITNACDPLLSAPAGPAAGVLRDRGAPDATTGSVVGSCGTPVVMFQNFLTNTILADTQNFHLRFTCVRRDPGIAWVQFSVTGDALDTIGPVYFAPDSDTASIDYTLPALRTNSTSVTASCVVGTIYNQVSQPRSCVINPRLPFTQQREAVFFAGQLLTTALSASDPLLGVLNNGSSFCTPAYYVSPDVSGMVAMQFSVASGTPLFIQAYVSNVWNDVALVTPDSNNVYWVSYPACLIGPVPPFQGCTMNNFPNDTGCDQHVARAADNGPVAPLRIRFRLTKGTREYRVYRRADDGPLTLFAAGPAVFDPANPNKIIETKDEAMPPSPSRLCYFVQVLNEQGNGSPLAFVGCKDVKPEKPQRPVLSEPLAAGTLASPQVVLNWFCPTAGVSRFQIKIKRLDPPATNTSSGILGLQLKLYPGFNKQASYLGLSRHVLSAMNSLSVFLALNFDDGYLTSPVGGGLGPGPQFTLTASVVANAHYLICVTPVDDQGNVQESATSEAWPFTWTPAFQPQSVPWPARPLPPATTFDSTEPLGVAPVLLRIFNQAMDARYPVGVRIGRINPDTDELDPTYNVGTDTYGGYTVVHNSSGASIDPNTMVFRRKSTGELLLPVVLYRQQITNAYFPKVSGDVTQVSPLIERVPWGIVAFSADFTTVVIPDRLFAVGIEFTQSGSYPQLYLRDQQPVQLGAAYRYYLVRFNAKREAQEIIQAGDLDIPLQP